VSGLDVIVDGHWTQASRMATAGASFADPETLAALDGWNEAALDDLDFAVAELDDTGVIRRWNSAAAAMSGTAVTRAVGHHFFGEVAPCTSNALFGGVFRRGVRDGAMNLVFFYTFSYKVSAFEGKVHLFRSDAGRNWVMVRAKS
jgi:photoactive yellow protein